MHILKCALPHIQSNSREVVLPCFNLVRKLVALLRDDEIAPLLETLVTVQGYYRNLPSKLVKAGIFIAQMLAFRGAACTGVYGVCVVLNDHSFLCLHPPFFLKQVSTIVRMREDNKRHFRKHLRMMFEKLMKKFR